jgi:hypothetical protein
MKRLPECNVTERDIADILLKCSDCGQQIAVGSICAGQTLQCPHCNAGLAVQSPDVSFSCPSCQSKYCSTTSCVGVFFDCPNCGKPVQVPVNAPTAPKLALQRHKAEAAIDVPKATSKPCPHCHSTLPTGSVFCVHCGTDLRTGRQVKSGKAFYKNIWIVVPSVVVLAALVVSVMNYNARRRRSAISRAIEERHAEIMDSTESVEQTEEAISSLGTLQESVVAAGNREWSSRVDQSITELERRLDKIIQEKAAEEERQAQARAIQIEEEEKRRISQAAQLEEKRQKQDDMVAAPERQQTIQQTSFDQLYTDYLSKFGPPLGRTLLFQLLNGSEIMGEVVSLSSTSVNLTKGKANISLHRDELQLSSWLQCSGEDYARYHANKKLGRPQEEYIQQMIAKQDDFEESAQKRELAKKKKASKYKVVHEKVKCPSCGGKGYKSGLRKANGSYSKNPCIRCRGTKYVTKKKRVLKKPDAVARGGSPYVSHHVASPSGVPVSPIFDTHQAAMAHADQLNRNQIGGMDSLMERSIASGGTVVGSADMLLRYKVEAHSGGRGWVVVPFGRASNPGLYDAYNDTAF